MSAIVRSLKYSPLSQLYLFYGRPVENFGLKENAGIFISDTGQQQALRFGRATGDDNLEAGRVSKVRLGRLRVVESPVTHGSPGGSEGQRPAVKQVSTTVSVLRSLVDNLESRAGH